LQIELNVPEDHDVAQDFKRREAHHIAEMHELHRLQEEERDLHQPVHLGMCT